MRTHPALTSLLFLFACGGGEGSEDLAGQADEARPGPQPHEAPAEPPAPEPTHIEYPGGLVVDVLEPGSGERARVGDRLRVHYSARLAGSEESFESTLASGIPYAFELGAGEVIEGWERGLVGIRAGSKLKLSVPAALGYGSEGMGRVPADTDLEFELHLVGVER
jgi:FKBP-type peptidyl-prolyl cis-trans isomerase